MNEPTVSQALDAIGPLCATPRDWIDIAMACLDQAGLRADDQDRLLAASLKASDAAEQHREARAARLAGAA